MEIIIIIYSRKIVKLATVNHALKLQCCPIQDLIRYVTIRLPNRFLNYRRIEISIFYGYLGK